MKRAGGIAALLCACLAALSLCACSPRAPAGTLDSLAPESALSVRPSDEGVTDFLALLDDPPAMYEDDQCFNITPDFILDNSDYRVFKYSESCASYLLYDGAVYPLGIFFGGSGADSFALADLTGDGEYELYFTFSWGSGMHRSMIGYFDPAQKEATVFDVAFWDADCMLTLGEKARLEVSRAEFTGRESFVSFDIAAVEVLGSIAFEEGEIRYAALDRSAS